MESFNPGQIIDGRYQVQNALGEGGMGVVLRAKHTEMNRTVAIKLLKPALVPDKEKLERFIHEARTVSRLKHENIVHVYSVGLTKTGQPYIAMEYLEGKRLSDLIEERGGMKAEEALPIFIQVCDALSHAHQHKIIHRDIKPSNIMLVEEKGKMQVKVVDFGIAKSVAENAPNITQTGMLMGSAFYMSPGQCAGRAPDLRSDVYSLGCTLFEALTGQPPFQGENFFETLGKQFTELPPAVNEINPDAKISAELQAVIDCMLQKDPVNRYQSMAHLKADLKRVLTGARAQGIPDQQKTTAKYLLNVQKPRKSHVFLLVLILGIVAASVGLTMFFTKQQQQQPRGPSVMEKARAHRQRAMSLRDSNRFVESAREFEKEAELLRGQGHSEEFANAQRGSWRSYMYEFEHTSNNQLKPELARKADEHMAQAIAALTAVVEPEIAKGSRFADSESRQSLTLLMQCYGDAYTFSMKANNYGDAAAEAREFLRLYEARGDVWTKAKQYVPIMVSFLCETSVKDGRMDEARNWLRRYDELVKQGDADPDYLTELQALVKQH